MIARVHTVRPLRNFFGPLDRKQADLCCLLVWRRRQEYGSQQRNILTSAMQQRVESMVKRHDEIMDEMQTVSSSSPGSFSSLGKELSSLARIVSLHQKKIALDEQKVSLAELLEEVKQENDADMEKDCREELKDLKEQSSQLEQQIIQALLPTDEDDAADGAIIEVRAGTGGDEASIFASELLEAYVKTAATMKWSVEVLSENKTDLGGIRDAVLSVTSQKRGGYDQVDEDSSGDSDFKSSIGPYGLFKYESGVHRVQRVPVNDTRIHTSACSVAALPMLGDSDNTTELLPMSELQIETMRSSGAGGQSVNTTDSAVRITHIPTGITAAIQDERSQHKNKAKALKLIAARVRDRQRREEEKERGATRSSLLGKGDRSERIRTYNFPQDRVTDHRCKHSTHGISKLLQSGADDGLVVTFYPYLRDMSREELMQQFLKENA